MHGMTQSLLPAHLSPRRLCPAAQGSCCSPFAHSLEIPTQLCRRGQDLNMNQPTKDERHPPSP